MADAGAGAGAVNNRSIGTTNLQEEGIEELEQLIRLPNSFA